MFPITLEKLWEGLIDGLLTLQEVLREFLICSKNDMEQSSQS